MAILLERKKLLVLIAMILPIVIIAFANVFLSPQFLREEYVGGKYDCRIGITGKDQRGFEEGALFYVKNGVEHQGYFNSYLRTALDWIRANTSENTIVLNWWDYGHMIVGYAERDSVIKNPSQEALISVKNPSGFQELDPHPMIVDVAKALTTINVSETLVAMNKYNATYIMVTVDDGKTKPYWIFHFAGLNFTDYLNASWQDTGLPFDPNQYNTLGKETIMYKILVNSQIQGLIQVYSDQNVRIYKR